VLAGRDADALDRIARDAWVRSGRPAAVETFDARDPAGHEAFLDACFARAGGLDGVVVCHGVLVEQARAERDPAAALAMLEVNVAGTLSLLEGVARRLEAAGAGWLAALSSVAGDRGRQSNYVYGAAKGALSLYLQGLRNRLHASKVRVITIKPGFVDTAMTYGLPGMFLVASPQYIGERIVAALGRSSDVVYLPWFWRYIMLLIRLIPEPVFKRMKL